MPSCFQDYQKWLQTDLDLVCCVWYLHICFTFSLYSHGFSLCAQLSSDGSKMQIRWMWGPKSPRVVYVFLCLPCRLATCRACFSAVFSMHAGSSSTCTTKLTTSLLNRIWGVKKNNPFSHSSFSKPLFSWVFVPHVVSSEIYLQSRENRQCNHYRAPTVHIKIVQQTIHIPAV